MLDQPAGSGCVSLRGLAKEFVSKKLLTCMFNELKDPSLTESIVLQVLPQVRGELQITSLSSWQFQPGWNTLPLFSPGIDLLESQVWLTPAA